MKYDLAIIGAGPGGYTAALKAASLGLSVALIEKDLMGGTCLNRGCIPTKALLRASELYKSIKGASLLGIQADALSYDMARMHERAGGVVSGLRTNLEALLKKSGIDCIHGRGRIESENTVSLDSGDAIECKNIIIASGSEVSMPKVEGLAECALTSDDILAGREKDADEIVIVGGGVVGCEMAEIYSALGKKVTILEFKGRILSNLDREISQTLSASFKKRGISVITGAQLTACKRENGRISCEYTLNSKSLSILCDMLVSAAGRRANTSGLLPDGFIDTVGSAIVTDECHRTSRKNIYAIGDAVYGATQLAHYAAACGKNAACLIAGKEKEVDESVVPCCVYTDPEIACVGVSKEEAAEKGITATVKKYPLSANGKAAIETDERGFVKLVADPDGVLIGAQIVSPRASDMISELALAISKKMKWSDVAGVIHPHPTFSEAIADAAELFG